LSVLDNVALLHFCLSARLWLSPPVDLSGGAKGVTPLGICPGVFPSPPSPLSSRPAQFSRGAFEVVAQNISRSCRNVRHRPFDPLPPEAPMFRPFGPVLAPFFPSRSFLTTNLIRSPLFFSNPPFPSPPPFFFSLLMSFFHFSPPFPARLFFLQSLAHCLFPDTSRAILQSPHASSRGLAEVPDDVAPEIPPLPRGPREVPPEPLLTLGLFFLECSVVGKMPSHVPLPPPLFPFCLFSEKLSS